jgi:hypothetical protein
MVPACGAAIPGCGFTIFEGGVAIAEGGAMLLARHSGFGESHGDAMGG